MTTSTRRDQSDPATEPGPESALVNYSAPHNRAAPNGHARADLSASKLHWDPSLCGPRLGA